ncbi:protein CURVATURE THYLAKOID 1B, chloroplastic isoform X1 [Arachis hypogaea]|uniref:protein CURVATURE THYLAKOID 1B, chloroplastic isoform X1 n=1 Tax=Arachis hypogaea TaxID=3818 RepID=UPI003B221B9D
MASTSSSTLTISSSSTLVDAKAPKHSSTSSPQSVTLPTLPLRTSKATAFCRKLARNVMAMATTGEAPPSAVATDVASVEVAELPEFVKTLQEAWDKVEDKYAVSSIAVFGGVALWGSTGVISAIDRLPLIPGLLEVVGIGYTGVTPSNFTLIVFLNHRDAFIRKVKETYKEIIGSSY